MNQPLTTLHQHATDDVECLHGMNPQWCGICQGMVARSAYSTPSTSSHIDGPSKQDLLDKVCHLLELPRVRIGEGSSLPSSVFRAAAKHAEVAAGSMPEIGERITVKAGLVWGLGCDSRDTTSAGGSTVTREGLDVMILALETLAARTVCVECGEATDRNEHIDGMCFECVDMQMPMAA